MYDKLLKLGQSFWITLYIYVIFIFYFYIYFGKVHQHYRCFYVNGGNLRYYQGYYRSYICSAKAPEVFVFADIIWHRGVHNVNQND